MKKVFNYVPQKKVIRGNLHHHGECKGVVWLVKAFRDPDEE